MDIKEILTELKGATFNDHYGIEDWLEGKLTAIEKRHKISVGMLRQWLNEDRITDPKKMVTNEQIEIWFEGINKYIK